MTLAAPTSSLVQSWDEEFVALFPHRYDFIYAPHPIPGASVEWQTESRYPLNDRLIFQGAALYGVRFGAQTNYCLLDVDKGSSYHPARDPFAIARMVSALEPLGFVTHIACTSSYSGGLHLYFPFDTAQSSWKLAIAVTVLLESAGFKIAPGHLEVFPNPKPYVVDQKPTLFNAHRLPLQSGSYLLNDAFEAIWSTHASFVDRWNFAQARNEFDSAALKQILKQARRRHIQVSGKADKFLNDLNAEIELGWIGYGQTNRLLGRITMRAYIFHHVLNDSEPLVGQSLVDEIVKTARSLPGYEEWCRHRHEIEHRAAEWARCIEQSHYFHYGTANGKFKPKREDLDSAIEKLPTWNEQQSQEVRERIRNAIADLLEKESLPSTITSRFQALTTYGIGGSSLYRHRDLWHPKYLKDQLSSQSNLSDIPSLFPSDGSNNSYSNASSVSDDVNPSLEGRNSENAHPIVADEGEHNPLMLNSAIQVPLLPAKQVSRIQGFLASGDSILVMEAMSWVRTVLNVDLQRHHIASIVCDRLQQLEWSDLQVANYLLERFATLDMTNLTDIELLQWCLDLCKESTS